MSSPHPPPSKDEPRPAVSSAAPMTDTPLLRQWRSLKARHPDALLFFRLGDFYELFHEDARRAAPLLEVVLTQRQGVPMCGVPHHAFAGYLARVLRQGHSAAIAEQMEDPALAKGMVRRDIVRLVTPGTVLEEELLEAGEHHWLVSLWPGTAEWGLAAADLSTGDLWVSTLAGSAVEGELARLAPKEILWPGECPGADFGLVPVTRLAKALFQPGPALRRWTQDSLQGWGLSEGNPALSALGALVAHVTMASPGTVDLLRPPRFLEPQATLQLDERALKNLELFPEDADGDKTRTLWSVMQHTRTPMGARRLKWWLRRPLGACREILQRQALVQAWLEAPSRRRQARECLKDVADIERILSRLATGAATGRDLSGLRRTCQSLPGLRQLLDISESAGGPSPLAEGAPRLSLPEALPRHLTQALADEPPTRLAEGGVIRDGFSKELDDWRAVSRRGRDWMNAMESRVKNESGLSNLKVGYNSVFGYYLEVSKGQVSKVPGAWMRKQTLANAERYVTPELKVEEEKILAADQEARRVEMGLLEDLCRKILEEKIALARVASALADLDALLSLAETAERERWTRPEVVEENVLDLEGARHPVVERALANHGGAPFVPNDLFLDESRRTLILTGPNMGGKSTYLRQTALVVLLAHAGSYVPAARARVGLTDRLFTRIGAGDNLAAGQSTFMVEMREVSRIVSLATSRSLVLLDEMGRGTSTYDGVAVAWAVVEQLNQPERAPKTLFATHYFELTALADSLPTVSNAHAEVREWTRPDGGTDVVFLHHIAPGSADRSYGVHVAQMAGLPKSCVARAREVLAQLEKTPPPLAPETAPRQLHFSPTHPVVEALERLDVDRLTPLEALQFLHRWKGESPNSRLARDGGT